MTSSFIISQEASLQAPQHEVDKIAKGQSESQMAQVSSEQVFKKMLKGSMHEVNRALQAEREDCNLNENDEDEQQQEEE